MTDREMKKNQEESLYENIFAQGMVKAKKLDDYMLYLEINCNKVKSGMTAEEIEAVQKRAEDSVKRYLK